MLPMEELEVEVKGGHVAQCHIGCNVRAYPMN